MAPPVTNDGFCASKPKYRQKNRRKALTEKQWGAALALVPQINQNHRLLKLLAKGRKETLKNIPLAAERPGGLGTKHVLSPNLTMKMDSASTPPYNFVHPIKGERAVLEKGKEMGKK